MGFWLRWVFANLMAWGMAVPVAFLFAMDFAFELTNDFLLITAFFFGTGALMGALVGMVQSLVLWRHLPRSHWWVLSSAAGVMVGFPVALAAEDSLVWLEPFLLWEVFGGVIGASLGGAQGIVLRQVGYSVAWWALFNMLGGALGCAVAFSPDFFWPKHSFLEFGIRGALGGALGNAVTGIPLARALRRFELDG